MVNNDLEIIYDQLKDKYDLLLTNSLSLDAGFDSDFTLLTGRSKLGIFYLYPEYFTDGTYMFVFSADLTNGQFTHWHPLNKEYALEDVIAFMEGTHEFCL